MTPRDLEKAIEAMRYGICRSPSRALARILKEEGHESKPDGIISPQVVQRISARLVSEWGVNPDLLKTGDRRGPTGESRAETADRQRNEKAGGAPVRRTVILSHQRDASLRFGNMEVRLPPGASLNLRCDAEERITADGIILVENWEAFEQFHRLDFPVPEAWREYPLLFWGAPHVSSKRDVLIFLKHLSIPVIVFPDCDPAGLGMACRVPGFQDILWPGAERLERELSGWRARRDLFDAQKDQYAGILDARKDTAGLVWRILKRYGAGVVQEVFVDSAGSRPMPQR